MSSHTIKGDNFTMTEPRPEWMVRAEKRQLGIWPPVMVAVVLGLIFAVIEISILTSYVERHGTPALQDGDSTMSTRTIHVGDWNAQGLLPVEIADRAEEGSNVKLLRFTPEEARELELLLHEANAERDE